MATISIVVMFVLNITGCAQQTLYKDKIDLVSGLTDRRESFPVINKTDSSVSLFLLDNKKINGFLFNKNFELLGRLSIDRPMGKFKSLLGSSIVDGKYNLFFADAKHSDFGYVSVDYEDKKGIQGPIDLVFKKEKYVESFTYDNKFVVITTSILTSLINLYTFNDPVSFNKQSIDLSKYQLTKDPPNNFLYATSEGISFIENDIPNSIDKTCVSNKIYHIGNELVITLDNELNRTVVISIDLSTYSSTVRECKQDGIECGHTNHISSNSYLYNNALYQFKICPAEAVFSIRDLKRDTLATKIRISKSEMISFNNSPLTQEGGMFTPDAKVELSKSAQFLRKAADGKSGVSVYRILDTIIVTLGGYKLTEQMGGMTGGMGGPTSTSMGIIPSYNPVYLGYSSYKYSRSTYFKSLFDPKTHEHMTGQVPQNAFDKIKSFTKDIEDQISIETIFKINGAYILGYYDDRFYVLKRFVD